MTQKFIDKWLRDISECNKLEFYSDIKSKFKIEPYPNLVETRSHKNALTRLRTSVPSLRIETGCYKRYDKDLKAYTNTPRGERKYPICIDDIEYEYHFLIIKKSKIKSSGTHSLNTYQRHINNSMKRMKRIKSNFFSTHSGP